MNAGIQGGRYLITGGAGFIGSHLCERLLEHGCDVICVDNFLTGRKGNVKAMLSNPHFTFLEHNVVEPLKLEGKIDGIFHMASPASPVDYLKFPIETLHAGAIGSDQILRLAKEKGARVLVASTSEVYGDPKEHPQKESYWGNVNPIGPRGCYDESKRYLEALTMAYRRAQNVDTRIVRIFNTYGPRMRTDDGRVVPNFCIQALTGKDVTVYGDGKQTRSFCYVDDLVSGLMTVFSGKVSDPVNLGNPDEYTIETFARRIIKASGANVKLTFLPLPEDDPKTRRPDITRAQGLGWKPHVDLETGLSRTLAYFKEQL